MPFTRGGERDPDLGPVGDALRVEGAEPFSDSLSLLKTWAVPFPFVVTPFVRVPESVAWTALPFGDAFLFDFSPLAWPLVCT